MKPTTWNSLAGTCLTALWLASPMIAFKYDKSGTMPVVIRNPPLELTRNACTIDEPEEFEAYLAGISEWNAIPNVRELFRDRFFSDDCDLEYGDEANEVILVTDLVVEGEPARGVTLYDKFGKIDEADILVATDPFGILRPFRVGTTDLPSQPSEWSPDNANLDTFGVYLHELGHAIGLAHDGGEQANLMESGIRKARVGDNREPAFPSFDAPTWATVLPDERDGARAEYRANGGESLWFASAQYFGPNLGTSFMSVANAMTRSELTPSFCRGAMNWSSVINRDGEGDRFGEVFASAFLEGESSLDGLTIKTCAGQYLDLPFSMGLSGIQVAEACHSFSLVDSEGRLATNFLARMSECSLVAKPRFQSGKMQIKLAEFLAPGIYRVFYNVNTCTNLTLCRFVSTDDRTFDNGVETQIRIRVETHQENPDCPEDPLNEPISTFCLAPLSPKACSSEADCEGLDVEIEDEYRRQLGQLWDSQDRYQCLPAAENGNITLGPPTFRRMTCQCEELERIEP